MATQISVLRAKWGTMARARNIKPGLYKNEDLAECSVWARFIFPGLWMLADRDGRLEDRPKRIKGELLPFDSQDVEPLLVELEERGFLVRYRNSDGRFIQISKFATHQTPHYSEKQSVIKPPNFPESGGDDGGVNPGGLPENSGNDPSLRGGRNPLNPDSLNPDSLNPECGSSDCDSGSPESAHTLPKEYLEVIKTLRPELDATAVYAKFCAHKPAKQRTIVTWRQWVADERIPAAKPSSVSDPESRASVEALGIARGMGKWNELSERWPAYKARVQGVAA